MEEAEARRELQLLPTTPSSSSSLKLKLLLHRSELPPPPPPPPPPSINLQLSISLDHETPPSKYCHLAGGTGVGRDDDEERIKGSIEGLKREAAEQIRLAAVEKAYAERVRELTRREMEMAEAEFARAKHAWERAQAEVESARRLKEKATTTGDRRMDYSTCMEEITCQACRQRFRAYRTSSCP